jgi:hypothetical protein
MMIMHLCINFRGKGGLRMKYLVVTVNDKIGVVSYMLYDTCEDAVKDLKEHENDACAYSKWMAYFPSEYVKYRDENGIMTITQLIRLE